MINIPNQKIKKFRARIRKWHSYFITNYPWRKTKNKWHALVAEIMLQRTNADQVVPIYNDFVVRFPSAEHFYTHMLEFKENIFKNLGLEWRNKYLVGAAKYIMENEIPLNKKELMKIPGVGEYAASAFLSLHFNIKEAIIDSNIVRLYARYFNFEFDGETRRKRWFKELANRITPDKEIKKFNYSILDFSRNICITKPKCNECVLYAECLFEKK